MTPKLFNPNPEPLDLGGQSVTLTAISLVVADLKITFRILFVPGLPYLEHKECFFSKWEIFRKLYSSSEYFTPCELRTEVSSPDMEDLILKWDNEAFNH